MKLKDIWNTFNRSSHWLILILLTNMFFILMGWIAYPEKFSILVGLMIIFSIFVSILGFFISNKIKKKQDEAFFKFLENLSIEYEDRLIENFGEIHREKINILGNRLREYKEAQEEVQEKFRDYEEFIESWVHEIKKPIALGTLVLGNRKDEMSPLVHQRLDHTIINIREQVEKILFYARLQTVHVDYRLEKIDLNDCYDDLIIDMNSMIEEKDISVVSEIGNITVVSDKKSLQFILSQILTNAIKYSKDNTHRFIWLRTGFDQIQNRHYLSISDNGIGVSASDLPFIFDKGFTGDNYKESHSTGIGLYLVKKLCDGINIDIGVASKAGEGFTIKLLFPIVN